MKIDERIPNQASKFNRITFAPSFWPKNCRKQAKSGTSSIFDSSYDKKGGQMLFNLIFQARFGIYSSVAYLENRQRGEQGQEGARSKGRHPCRGRFLLTFFWELAFFRNTFHENFPLTLFFLVRSSQKLASPSGAAGGVVGRLRRQRGDMSQCPPPPKDASASHHFCICQDPI